MSKSAVKKSETAWPALGNEPVIAFLEKNIATGQIAQTYIFAGASDLGKFTIAQTFALKLLASDSNYYDGGASNQSFNSDIHILQKKEGKKNIGIDETRDFIKVLALSSFLNSYKIGIIKEAELLSNEAASALLKTLEEPREKVVIILVVNNLEALPETIVSRSRLLHFYPLATSAIYDFLLKEKNLDRSLANNLASLALGRPLLALKLLDNPDIYEEQLKIASVFLSFLPVTLNDRYDLLNNIWSDRLRGPEAMEKARGILNIWQGVARDLSLLHWGQAEDIQYFALRKDLEDKLVFLRANLGEEQLAAYFLQTLNRIRQSQKYLEANVGAHYSLENILINI